MRVLIVGAGAVGGYYGGRILEAGRDVTFLVRPRRREQLTARGLCIKSPLGDVELAAPTVLADEIKAPWDLVVLSCKAYDLAGAIDSLAKAVGPQSMILPLLNGMAHLDVLTERFGGERVLGGLCSIAVTVDDQGSIVHLNHLHNLAFGERVGGESARTKAVAELLGPAKFEWSLSSAIILEMWEKWVFLAALAAGTCLMRASVGDIMKAGGAATLAGLLAETQSIASAAGHAARPHVLANAHGMLSAAGSALTASMLRDVEKGGPIENEHVIGDLVRRAQAFGVAVPLLELAHLHLKAYEARREGGSGPK